MNVLVIVVILGLAYFFLMLPARRRRTASSSARRETPAAGTWSRHIAMSLPRSRWISATSSGVNRVAVPS